MSKCSLDRDLSLNKFRGTLVGALIGDCLGVPFEGFESVAKVDLQKYFDKMEDPNFKSPLKTYSDDTAMTKAITESLIENTTVNVEDIAKRFVAEFYFEPNRGYGEQVVNIFKKLRSNKFSDVWGPAKEQFNGSGSLGNGGAMRISPVALFFNSDYHMMLEAVEKCTKITHTHRLGVNGALLQAVALNESYFLPSDKEFDIDVFLGNLISKMASIEAVNNEGSDGELETYENQLKEVQNLLKKEDPSDDEVLEVLGNGVRAFYSVPTAIYCFLRAQNPIQNIETDNKFRRAVQYSISLGGDTDTIASMAGALSGAYHGYDYIGKEIQAHCEGLFQTISLADKLHSKAPLPTDISN